MTPTAKQLRAEVDRHLEDLGELEELSDERYHTTHECFEAASDQRKLILEWFGGLAGRIDRTDDQRPKLLSVGCGGGVMDRCIADVIAKSTGPIDVTGIDPNPRHIPAFADAFSGGPHQIRTFIGGFDDFQADIQFDLIYFLHSLYYFDTIEPALARAAESLRPNGTMVVLQAPNGDLNHLADRVWRKQFDQSAWYSDDVQRVLDSMEGDTSMTRIDAHVDVTPCFDEHDAAGVELLDFIVQADTRRFSPAFRESLRDSLDSICTNRDGRRLAPHPVDALVFTAN